MVAQQKLQSRLDERIQTFRLQKRLLGLESVYGFGVVDGQSLVDMVDQKRGVALRQLGWQWQGVVVTFPGCEVDWDKVDSDGYQADVGAVVVLRRGYQVSDVVVDGCDVGVDGVDLGVGALRESVGGQRRDRGEESEGSHLGFDFGVLSRKAKRQKLR